MGEWDTLICRVPVSTRPIMTTAPASMQIVINRLLRLLCITKGPPLVERGAHRQRENLLDRPDGHKRARQTPARDNTRAARGVRSVCCARADNTRAARGVRSVCCARAASGHVTDAPPSSVMNVRRFIFAVIRSPRPRSRATCQESAALARVSPWPRAEQLSWIAACPAKHFVRLIWTGQGYPPDGQSRVSRCRFASE
jgi:hypothetical protein